MVFEIINAKPDPEDADMARGHVADIVADLTQAGIGQEELEEIGYVTEGIGHTAVDYEVEASGQLLMNLEAALENLPEKGIRIRQTPAPTPETKPIKPVRKYRRRPARTSRDWAVRDSRPDLKPWPYGSRED